MSSAGTGVIERSEPTGYDRSCSILLLDDFFLLWSFLKTDPGPQNRKLESSVMLRDPDQGHYSPKNTGEGKEGTLMKSMNLDPMTPSFELP